MRPKTPAFSQRAETACAMRSISRRSTARSWTSRSNVSSCETLFASLATALAEGRLAVDEYDTRCRQIAAAATRADAAGAFADLPDDPTARLGSAGDESEDVYTATEIAEQRRQLLAHVRQLRT